MYSDLNLDSSIHNKFNLFHLELVSLIMSEPVPLLILKFLVRISQSFAPLVGF